MAEHPLDTGNGDSIGEHDLVVDQSGSNSTQSTQADAVAYISAPKPPVTYISAPKPSVDQTAVPVVAQPAAVPTNVIPGSPEMGPRPVETLKTPEQAEAPGPTDQQKADQITDQILEKRQLITQIDQQIQTKHAQLNAARAQIGEGPLPTSGAEAVVPSDAGDLNFEHSLEAQIKELEQEKQKLQEQINMHVEERHEIWQQEISPAASQPSPAAQVFEPQQTPLEAPSVSVATSVEQPVAQSTAPSVQSDSPQPTKVGLVISALQSLTPEAVALLSQHGLLASGEKLTVAGVGPVSPDVTQAIARLIESGMPAENISYVVGSLFEKAQSADNFSKIV